VRVTKEKYDDPFRYDPDEGSLSKSIQRISQSVDPSWNPRNPPTLFQKLLRFHILQCLEKLSDRKAAQVGVRVYRGVGTTADYEYGADGVVIFERSDGVEVFMTYDATLDPEKRESKGDLAVTLQDLESGIRNIANKIVKRYIDKRKQLRAQEVHAR
jgi:hypothetical protein